MKFLVKRKRIVEDSALIEAENANEARAIFNRMAVSAFNSPTVKIGLASTKKMKKEAAAQPTE